MKLAAVFSIAYAALRQGQVEKTMNINMTSQMVLAKMADFQVTNDVDMATLDHESFLNKIFNIVSFFISQFNIQSILE